MKTIVSLSTPRINSAIHVIRISGTESFAIVQKIVDKKIIRKGYQIQRLNIKDKNKVIDNVLLLKFIAPHSFTGDDTIEINCHGGLFLAQKIISLLIKNGCVQAKNGEFSERSFLNKKMSLIEAQAINNLINATNEKALEAANNSNTRKVYLNVLDIRNYLFKITGQLEVNIDYPEYDDEPVVSLKKMILYCDKSIKSLSKLVSDSRLVVPYRDGINVAIIGKPNVGKSSILNAIVGEERVIVSSTAGTTRDTVDTRVNLNGITVNFIDTAGIHETKNAIEKIGIKKTTEVIKKADLILLVIDNSKKINSLDQNLIEMINGKKFIIVKNKSDLKKINKISGVDVSAKKGEIKRLILEISKKIETDNVSFSNIDILQSTQSISIVEACVQKLSEIKTSIQSKQTLDSQLNNLHDVIDNLNAIIGETKSFDFIEEMFRNFCLGK